MAELSLEELTKIYPNGFKAVDELSIDIADGEFLVLVGPSGCGKSTALRMVAGLEEITSGNLSINGEQMNDVVILFALHTSHGDGGSGDNDDDPCVDADENDHDMMRVCRTPDGMWMMMIMGCG